MAKIDNLDPKEVKVTCPNCHGSGKKQAFRGNHSSIYGMRKCYTCMGEGEVTMEEERTFRENVEKKLKELKNGS